MRHRRLLSVLTHLHRSLGHTGAEGLADAELLDRFVRQRDESAFELLVWRHERMVLGVCRRLLRDEHGAEDAFQAAFLALARKASSIGRREAVASWLYKVAYRCALRVRESVRRQRQSVVSGVDPADVAVRDSSLAAVEQSDLRELLDEEVQRLPAKYRAAVVLCYLEGKSYQKAAEELGCPAGTLSARLHQARERLRRRLTARGVAPAAALAVLEGARETHAAARLAVVAVQAAQRILAGQSAAEVVSSRTLEICTGVMQAMSASKQKIVIVFVLLACLSGLTSWAALRALPQASREQRAEKNDKPVSVKKEQKSATWQECARLRSAVGQSHAVLFAPNGSALAAFDDEDCLRVRNTSDWRPRWEYRCRDRYGKHLSYFTSFSPDGRLVHVVGYLADTEKPGQCKAEVMILDAINGREVAHLPGYFLIYSPDKTMLATFQKNGVTLWDAHTFRKLRKFELTPVDGYYFCVFSKDASLVCIQTRERCCQLWETATGKERARLEGFMPEISPDGKTVSTILPGGIVKLWDTADGRERVSIRKEGRTGCFASFSADSKRLLVRAYMELTIDGHFAELRKDRKPRQIPPRRIRPIDVCLYEAATGMELQRLPGMSDYDVLAVLSPDGRTVAYSRLEPDETEREEIVLWDVQSGRERAVLRTPEGIRNPIFSPNGATLLTMNSSGKNRRLWDVAAGRPVLDLPAEVGSVYFSPDGQWLAGVPSLTLPYQGPDDIRVFRRSDRPLPPPVIRGEATKPRTPSPPLPEPPKSEAHRALDVVRQEAQKYDQEVRPERERIEAYLRFGAKALKVARDFPTDPAALEALEFVLRITGGGAEGETSKLREEALAVVLRDHRRSPDLTPLLHTMSHQYTDSAEKALADLAENSPHRVVRGRAAWLLARGLADKAEASRLLRALPELLDD
ncbi:MAG TPA: sigma-70 family RNA polymerase sigma factor, partial [Gemmataceae bacterium]